MKRFLAIVIALALCLSCVGCQKQSFKQYHKYQYQFYDTFDTLVQVVGYTKDDAEFEKYAYAAKDSFVRLHQLFDKFNSYEGINNIKTINDNAGIAPVKVDNTILDLLEFCKQWYEKTGGHMDITMGAMLSIWQEYIGIYRYDSENAKLPEMAELEAAAALSGMDKLVIDRDAGTVYLTEPGMQLDVGSVAKGFATELVAKELEAMGWKSFSISGGGNIRVSGEPLSDVVMAWGIGIQDPFKDVFSTDSDNLLDVLFVNNTSVVTSGDYQRYYMVGDRRVHHIIDKSTMMPAENFRSVTIVTPDSGLADLLSTVIFVMDYEEGRRLVEELGVGAVWVFPDGRVEVTEDLIPLMLNRGGATSARQKR